MKNILLLFVILFISGCCGKYSKNNYFATRFISSGLYVEIFQVYSGGVYAGNSYSYYLTDSINFRIYIGTEYHDDEMLLCELIDSDTVKIYTVLWHSNDTFNIKHYSLETLIKEGKFE